MANLEAVLIRNKFKEFHLSYLIGYQFAIKEISRIYGIKEIHLRIIAAVEQLNEGGKIVSTANIAKLLNSGLKTYSFVNELTSKGYIQKERVGSRRFHLSVTLSGKQIERSYSEFMTKYSRSLELVRIKERTA
jgi:hypothetical protein